MRNKDKNKDFSAYIGKGCKLDGVFNFEGTGRIDGNFVGDVTSKDKLVVGQTGNIDGSIIVSELIVFGTITGKIESEKVTIHKTGKIVGEFKIKNLITESGAIIDGKISMQEKTKIIDLKNEKKDVK